MEIRKREVIKKTTFDQIDIGCTFVDEEGDLMMRIEESGGMNCVCLWDGSTYSFADDSTITPAKSFVEYSL
ncbi:MAG: hypothetical protein IKY62_00905 [Clostridia bacterium]|nr:hypothetical protein [Clostridia bacterium]